MRAALADPRLYEHVGGAPPTRAELEAQYERRERGHSPDGAQGWLNWIVRMRSAGEAAGYVQATLTEADGSTTAQLAWVIAQARQGGGLAGEAAAAVAEWLAAAGVAELTAMIAPANGASEKVAARLGMVATGERIAGEVRWVRDLRRG